MTANTTLIVLGASGDLTARLLMPALGQLLTREPDRGIRLIGAGMETIWDDARWREVVRQHRSRPRMPPVPPSTRSSPGRATGRRTSPIPPTSPRCWPRPGRPMRTVVRRSTSRCRPRLRRELVALEQVDLPDGLILALEKPFGTDQESARALNVQLAETRPRGAGAPDRPLPRSLHRAQRARRALHQPGVRAGVVLGAHRIGRHPYDEALALEGRAGYYDRAGALTDMIQSHLLQVLAVLAMDPPSTLGAVHRLPRCEGHGPAGHERDAGAGLIGSDFTCLPLNLAPGLCRETARHGLHMTARQAAVGPDLA